jgi:hypothetical protein
MAANETRNTRAGEPRRTHSHDAAGFVQNGIFVHFIKRFAMRFAGRKRQAISGLMPPEALGLRRHCLL